jgi:hypothetical protein
MATGSAPLFKHSRLIAATMLVALAAVSGAALYVRPLSGDLSTITRSGGAEQTARAALPALAFAAFPSNPWSSPPLL